MATPQSAVNTLRAINYRLASATDDQLPYSAAQVAGSVWLCKDLLSASPEVKQSSEASAALHRFKTQLSALLQHRSPRSRWSGLVLLKAVIEAGGYETLSKSNGWVRNVLAILKKRDPSSTRILCVVVLARVFTLTWEYSNLIREITTPALTAFVGTCLNNIESKTRCSTAELQAVLEAFAILIPRHPTIFRPHESALCVRISDILSGSNSFEGSSSTLASQDSIEAAEKVSILLHHCTPKQGVSEKWDEAWKTNITAAHTTCDIIFRCIEEQWESSAGVQPFRPKHQLLSSEPALESADSAGLDPWSGVSAGAGRLIELLHILSLQLRLPINAPVSCKFGIVADLISRIVSIRPSDTDRNAPIRFSSQISRDEREELFLSLPDIHIAVLGLIQALLQRFGRAVAPSVTSLAESVLGLYPSSRIHSDLRAALNYTMSVIVELSGPVLSKRDIADLVPLLRHACQTLIPSEVLPATKTSAGPSQVAATLPPPGSTASNGKSNAKAGSERQSGSMEPALLTSSCRILLLAVFSGLPSDYLPPKLRTQMDRTAILIQDRELLVASVLNPARREKDRSAQASLLPMLARLYPESSSVEAILRPRMPPLLGEGRSKIGEISTDTSSSTEHEDDEISEDEQIEAEGSAQDISMESAEANHVTNEQQSMQADAMNADRAVPAESSAITTPAKQKRRRSVGTEDVPGANTSMTSATEVPIEVGASKRSRVTPPTFAEPLQDGVETDSHPRNGEPSHAGGHMRNASHNVTEFPGSTAVSARDIKAQSLDENDEDGSDFEMPPLTMESDTDDDDN